LKIFTDIISAYQENLANYEITLWH